MNTSSGHVTVYTTQTCTYCGAAKRLLARLGVAYREVDVTGDDAIRRELVDVTGQRTVPQIFAGGRSLGGFSDIDALHRSGQLLPILRAEGIEMLDG